MDELHSHELKIYLHSFNSDKSFIIDFPKRQTASELIDMVLKRLNLHKTNTASSSSSNSSEKSILNPDQFDLLEIMGTLDGQTCKERKLDKNEYPVTVKLLWPRILPTAADEITNLTEYRFVLRQKGVKTNQGSRDNSVIDQFLQKFLQQQSKKPDKEYPDLCMLSELTEQTLMENLKDRFENGYIYTYIGPILVAVNPFKFYPIYNPKYAKLYENKRLGDLPPHIFAISDAAYHSMIKQRKNQCIVISGESGSGKTESTNFLLHNLTTLSQKGATATALEQTLLCAGPVLEAFGNAVTAQNNNSSRFGKFMQISYRENGMVYGASVQIYLLEKSRIISQAIGERNYHVFYYLLNGASEQDKETLCLGSPQDYNYLNKNGLFTIDSIDDKYELNRLKQSMESVGFSNDSMLKIFRILSSVLLLGNIQYSKRTGYHSDDTAFIANESCVSKLSQLLQIKEDKLTAALTTRRTVTKNETVITRYTVLEAKTARDAIAKCLYNALFDWIVFRINQALIKRETNTISKVYSIGILDIFGFEDLGPQNVNSFEQLCINYTNERLQAYFNQHIFQIEQEEYLNQGLKWTSIEYTDNTQCLQLMHSKPFGLFCLIDEECSVPKGTDETLLEKYNKYHKNNEFYETPHKKEPAFIIAHYAGKVKYQITNFKEKNKDLMRQDLTNVFKNSRASFVRELVSSDLLSVYRWAIVRACFRAMFAFKQAGKQRRKSETGSLHSLAQTKSVHRRSSESQLAALIKGDLDVKKLSKFCDTSVFSTIIEHVNQNGHVTNMDENFKRQCSLNLNHSTNNFSIDCMNLDSVPFIDDNYISNNTDNDNNNTVFSVDKIDNDVIFNTADNCYTNESYVKTNLHNDTDDGQSHKIDENGDNDNKNHQCPNRRWVRSRVLRFEDKQMQSSQYKQQSWKSAKKLVGDPPPTGSIFDDIRSNIELSKDLIECSEVVLETEEFLKKTPLRQFKKQQRSFKGLQALKVIIGKRPAVSRKTCTVTAQFQHSLSRLMDTLSNAHPFFIRCVKSNNDKVPCLFEEDIILKQLRYTGMLETVRIRRAGYSVRLTYDEFVQQYRIILPKTMRQSDASPTSLTDQSGSGGDWQNAKSKVIDFITWHPVVDRQNIQFGISKIFMRDPEKLLLDDQLHRTIMGHVVRLQSWLRTFILRRRFLRIRRMIIDFQAILRGHLVRTKYQTEWMAALCIQSYWRSYTCRRRFLTQKYWITKLQARCKGRLLRLRLPAIKAQKEQLAKRQISETDEETVDGLSGQFKMDVADFATRTGQDNDSYRAAVHERSTSLDATFVLENTKMKLLAIQDETDSLKNQANRRPSLYPESSNKYMLMKRSASSDHLTTNRIITASAKSDTETKKLNLPVIDVINELPDRNEKKKSGFFRAKRHIQAFLSLRSDSNESTDENVEPLVYEEQEKVKNLDKPKALCKLPFHKECSQFARRFPCDRCLSPPLGSPTQKSSVPARPWDPLLISYRASARRATQIPLRKPGQELMLNQQQQQIVTKWSLTKTSQFTDSADVVIGHSDDLRQLSLFIFQKFLELSKKSLAQRDTVMDSIFKEALQEYHTELLSYRAALKGDQIIMKYKDLVIMFEGTLSKVCVREQITFPVTLGLNAFRVFMNEFTTANRKRTKVLVKKQKKAAKKKAKKNEVAVVHLNHCFKADIVHIPTYCELCSQFMWYAENILICLGCRLSCHKKCYTKITYKCTSSSSTENLNIGSGRVFGTDLMSLVDEDHFIPVILEKLLICIEVHGLFCEGLYRKSGSMTQIKQLRKLIEATEDFDAINFDDIPVHVLTNLVKAFFRELNEPLLTFELYENFLSVAEVEEEKERLRCTCAMLELLPKVNKNVFERLTYHLARVAYHAEVNRMSSQNLAVIFAPCILKRQRIVKAQEQLEDVNRQTICLTALIDEKLRKYVLTLSDIIRLENAVEKVNENLRKIDQHLHKIDSQQSIQDVSPLPAKEIEQARLLFIEQLNYLDNEKDKLIEELPAPPLASSEDDFVASSSGDELEPQGSGAKKPRLTPTVFVSHVEDEFAVDFDLPPQFSTLAHHTKSRAQRPKRQRLPKKYANYVE